MGSSVAALFRVMAKKYQRHQKRRKKRGGRKTKDRLRQERRFVMDFFCAIAMEAQYQLEGRGRDRKIWGRTVGLWREPYLTYNKLKVHTL